MSLKVVIEELNRTLRGWFEYFKHSGKTVFPDEDRWIRGAPSEPAAQTVGTVKAGGVATTIIIGPIASLPSTGCSLW